MDAKSFSSFLKEIIINKSKEFESQLVASNYKTIEEAKRASGTYNALISVANSLDKILEDFYNKGGNATIIEASHNE